MGFNAPAAVSAKGAKRFRGARAETWYFRDVRSEPPKAKHELAELISEFGGRAGGPQSNDYRAD